MGNLQSAVGSVQDSVLLGVDRELWDDTSRELLSNLSLTSYKPPAHLIGSGVARTGLPAEDPSSLLGVSGADEKNGALTSAVKSHLMSEVASMAHDRSSNEYSLEVAARAFVLESVYAAVLRKVQAEKKSEQEQKNEIKQRAAAAFPSLTPASSAGIACLVKINLQFLYSVIQRNDTKLLSTVLSLAAQTLATTPALSLEPGPTFSPEIAAVCEPLFAFLRSFVVSGTKGALMALPPAEAAAGAAGAVVAADDSKAEDENRNLALGVMFGVALARGSVAEVLAVVDTILAAAASVSASATSGSALGVSCAQYVGTMIEFQPKPKASAAAVPPPPTPSSSVGSSGGPNNTGVYPRTKPDMRSLVEGTRWNYFSDRNNSSAMTTIDFNGSNRLSSGSYGAGDWSVIEDNNKPVLYFVFNNVAHTVCTLENDQKTFICRRHDGKSAKLTYNQRLSVQRPAHTLRTSEDVEAELMSSAGAASSAAARPNQNQALSLFPAELAQFPATPEAILEFFSVVESRNLFAADKKSGSDLSMFGADKKAPLAPPAPESTVPEAPPAPPLDADGSVADSYFSSFSIFGSGSSSSSNNTSSASSAASALKPLSVAPPKVDASALTRLTPLSTAVIVLSQLDRLSSEYSSPFSLSNAEEAMAAAAAQKGGSKAAAASATLLDSLRVECTPRVMQVLYAIVKRSAAVYLDEKQPAAADNYRLHALVVVCALRVLKAHLHQLVLSGSLSGAEGKREFAISDAQLEDWRTLIFSLMRTTPAHSALATRVIQAEASDVFYIGFTVFYPSIHSQLTFVVELTERNTKSPSAADQKLLPLLLAQFQSFTGLRFCLDGLEADPSSAQGEQTALSLRRLISGLISTVESQSLAALSSLSAAFTASADFEPPAEVEWGGSVQWLKSFQTHLMARAGHWLQMQAQEQLNKGSNSGSAAAAAAAGGSVRDQKQASSDSKLMTTDGFDADEAADAKALELKTGKEEKDSKKNDAPEPAVSAVTRTTDRVFGVVVEYAVLLSGAMQRLMTEYGRQLQSVKAQSIAVQWKVAKTGGENVLRRSLVGELGRGLLYSLASFVSSSAARTRPEVGLRLLPLLTQLLQTSSSLSTAVQTVMTLKRGNRLVEYKAELAAYQERKQLKEAEYKKAYAEWKAKEEASHSDDERKSKVSKKKKKQSKGTHPAPEKPVYGAPPKAPEKEAARDTMVQFERSMYVDSDHPYPANGDRERVIFMPGSTTLRLAFERVELANSQDWLDVINSKTGATSRYTGIVGANNAPSKPVMYFTNKVLLRLHSGNSAYRGWGYRIKVTGQVLVPALEWLVRDWTKLCVWVAGAFVQRLMQATPLALSERSHSDWLESALFQGGLSPAHPSFPAIDRNVLALCDAYQTSVPATPKPAAGSAEEKAALSEQTFVEQLLAGAPEVKVFYAELERRAAYRFMLPPSIKEPAERVTRAIFAASLKHNHLLPAAQHLISRLPLPAPAPGASTAALAADKRTLDSCVALYKKAVAVKNTFVTLKGNGTPIQPFVDTAMQRVQLLLQLTPSPAVAPNTVISDEKKAEKQGATVEVVEEVKRATTTSADRKGHSKEEEEQRKLAARDRRNAEKRSRWPRVKAALGMLSSTLRILRRLKDLMLVRKRLADDRDDPSSVVTASIVRFVTAPPNTILTEPLVAALQAQRTRGVIRLFALSAFEQLMKCAGAMKDGVEEEAVDEKQQSDSAPNAYVVELLRHFALAFGSESVSVPSGELRPAHVLEALESCGPAINQLLCSRYFGVLTSLVKNQTLDETSKLLVMSMLNLDLRPEDLGYLEQMELVQFLTPLVSFPSATPAAPSHPFGKELLLRDGSKFDTPFALRHAGWALFRLIAYLSADHAADTPTQRAFHHQLFEGIVFPQLDWLLASRTAQTAAVQTLVAKSREREREWYARRNERLAVEREVRAELDKNRVFRTWGKPPIAFKIGLDNETQRSYDFRDGILPWGVTPEGPVQWGKEADGSSYLYLPPGSTMKLNVDLKSNENGQLINQYSVIMDIRFPNLSPAPPSANRGLFTSKAGTSYAPVVLASGAMGVMGCYESSPKIKRDTWHRLVVTLDTKEYRMTFFCDGSQQYSYSHSSYMNRDGQLSIDGKTMQMFNSNDRSQTGAVQVAFVEVVSTKLTPMDVSNMGRAGLPSTSPNPPYRSKIPRLAELAEKEHLWETKSKDVKKDPMEEPLWLCMKCTYLNPLKAATCSLCALSRADSEELEKKRKESAQAGVKMDYQSDFDENGLIYYLGSERKTGPWRNPAETGVVQVTCSHYTTESGCAPVTAFIGRVGARVLTSTPPSGVRPWYQVDLMGRTFTPNAYTLRHYSSYDSAGLRNWALEGWSESASKWVVIRRHTDDRSLARASQAVTWRLMEDGASYCNPFEVVQNAPYSKFRIMSTGMQDSTEIMICSGFEIYGTLHEKGSGGSVSSGSSGKANRTVVAEYERWADRERHVQLADSANAWLNAHLQDVGVKGSPFDKAQVRVTFPTLAELNLFTSQYLWLLLRALRGAPEVVTALATPRWVDLFLSVAMTGTGGSPAHSAQHHRLEPSSAVIRILAIRILRHLLPLISPESLPSFPSAVAPPVSPDSEDEPPRQPPPLTRQESEGQQLKRALVTRLLEDIGEFSLPQALRPPVPPLTALVPGLTRTQSDNKENKESSTGGDELSLQEVLAPFRSLRSSGWVWECVDLFRVLMRGSTNSSGKTSVTSHDWSVVASDTVLSALRVLSNSAFQKALGEAGVAVDAKTGAVTTAKALDRVSYNQARDAFGALTILGGHLEPIRTGGTVLVAQDGSSQAATVLRVLTVSEEMRGKPSSLAQEKPKSHIARVQVQLSESGDTIWVSDLTKLTPEVSVAVPYHKLDNPDQLLTNLGDFTLQNPFQPPLPPVTAPTNSSKQQHMAVATKGVVTFILQRRALRVLMGLLERPALCNALVSKQASGVSYLDRLAAVATQPAPAFADGMGLSLANLHARVEALDRFERTSADPPAEEKKEIKPAQGEEEEEEETTRSDSLMRGPSQMYGFGSRLNCNHWECKELAFDNTVPKDVGWTTVVSNQYVHMALDDRNRVWTWGTGDYGRLGHANSDTVYSPRLVNLLAGKPVAQVAAGYNHALFLVEGKVYACGSASYYQLANNSSSSQSVPTLVNGISRPVNLIGAGGNHSFAQTEDGLYSWGQNQRGELGVGDRNTRTTPTRVNLPDASVRFVQITGGNYHSIALSTAGHVYTFGGAYNGPACGFGDNTDVLTPRRLMVNGEETCIQVAAGYYHSAILSASGQCYTCGYNNSGVLGNGSSNNNSTPIRMAGEIASVVLTFIAAESNHMAMVDDKGGVWTCGSASFCLGQSTNSSNLYTPKRIMTTNAPPMHAVAVGSGITFCLTNKEPRPLANLPMTWETTRCSNAMAPYPYSAYVVGNTEASHFIEASNGQSQYSLHDLVSLVPGTYDGPSLRKVTNYVSSLSSYTGSVPPAPPSTPSGQTPGSIVLTRSDSIFSTVSDYLFSAAGMVRGFSSTVAFRVANPNTQMNGPVLLCTAGSLKSTGDHSLSYTPAVYSFVVSVYDGSKVVKKQFRASAAAAQSAMASSSAQHTNAKLMTVTTVVRVTDDEKNLVVRVWVNGERELDCTIPLLSAIPKAESTRVTFIGNMDGDAREMAVWRFALTDKQARAVHTNRLNFVYEQFKNDETLSESVATYSLGTGTTPKSPSAAGVVLPPGVWKLPVERKALKDDKDDKVPPSDPTAVYLPPPSYLKVNRTIQPTMTMGLNVYTVALDVWFEDLPPRPSSSASADSKNAPVGRVCVFHPSPLNGTDGLVYVDSDGRVSLFMDRPGGNVLAHSFNAPLLQAKRWYRLVVVVDVSDVSVAQRQVAVYVDGKLTTQARGLDSVPSATARLQSKFNVFSDAAREKSTTGKTFERKFDFDNNGILYYLGTRKGARSFWTNPAQDGSVEVTVSEAGPDSLGPHAFVGRSAARSLTTDAINSWFQLDMLKHRVAPTAYTLRHYSSQNTHALRTWVLEASNDPKRWWHVLSTHNNDQALNMASATHTWDLDNNTFDVSSFTTHNPAQGYRYFRVRITGATSSGSTNNLCCAGFELYGTLDPKDTEAGKVAELKFANNAGAQVRAIQISRLAASASDVEKLGAVTRCKLSASTGFGFPGSAEGNNPRAQVLVGMGHPLRWAERALKVCDDNRRAASDWLLSSREALLSWDRREELRRSAHALARSGFPYPHCLAALQATATVPEAKASSGKPAVGAAAPAAAATQLNLEAALSWLLQNTDRLSKQPAATSATVVKPAPAAAADAKDKVALTITVLPDVKKTELELEEDDEDDSDPVKSSERWRAQLLKTAGQEKGSGNDKKAAFALMDESKLGITDSSSSAPTVAASGGEDMSLYRRAVTRSGVRRVTTFVDMPWAPPVDLAGPYRPAVGPPGQAVTPYSLRTVKKDVVLKFEAKRTEFVRTRAATERALAVSYARKCMLLMLKNLSQEKVFSLPLLTGPDSRFVVKFLRLIEFSSESGGAGSPLTLVNDVLKRSVWNESVRLAQHIASTTSAPLQAGSGPRVTMDVLGKVAPTMRQLIEEVMFQLLVLIADPKRAAAAASSTSEDSARETEHAIVTGQAANVNLVLFVLNLFYELVSTGASGWTAPLASGAAPVAPAVVIGVLRRHVFGPGIMNLLFEAIVVCSGSARLALLQLLGSLLLVSTAKSAVAATPAASAAKDEKGAPVALVRGPSSDDNEGEDSGSIEFDAQKAQLLKDLMCMLYIQGKKEANSMASASGGLVSFPRFLQSLVEFNLCVERLFEQQRAHNPDKEKEQKERERKLKERPLPGRVYKWNSDGDTNGFVYYLGTNEGKSSFSNPTSVGSPPNVRVNVPGMNSGSGYNVLLRDPEYMQTYDNQNTSWVEIEFPNHAIAPERYAFRHSSRHTNYYARNWELLGFCDGQWRTLRRHDNDTSLNSAGAMNSWDIAPQLDLNGMPVFFSKFKLAVHGRNSSNTWHFTAQGFELYGRVVDSATLAKFELESGDNPAWFKSIMLASRCIQPLVPPAGASNKTVEWRFPDQFARPIWNKIQGVLPVATAQANSTRMYGGPNVALGCKTVTQSSNGVCALLPPSLSHVPCTSARNAVDGFMDDNPYTNACTKKEHAPWWQIDLGSGAPEGAWASPLSVIAINLPEKSRIGTFKMVVACSSAPFRITPGAADGGFSEVVKQAQLHRLVSQTDVSSLQITLRFTPDEKKIPVRYVRIMLADVAQLELVQVRVFAQDTKDKEQSGSQSRAGSPSKKKHRLVVECTSGHGCTHYTAHRKPKGYTESFYICDVCRKNTTFNHEFWHCDECTNFDVCLNCAHKIGRQEEVVEEKGRRSRSGSNAGPAPAASTSSSAAAAAQAAKPLVLQEREVPLTAFHNLVSVFTPAANADLMALINRWCEKENKNPVENAHAINISPADVAAYKSLNAMQLKPKQLAVRIVTLCEFNRTVGAVLPFVDLSLPPGVSTLCDDLRSARDSIFWSQKRLLWEDGLSASVGPSVNKPTLNLEVLSARMVYEKKKTDHKAQRTLFGQVYQQLKQMTNSSFSASKAFASMRKNERAWSVNYIGMRSTDAGGPYRDSLETICRELQSPALPLFVRTPNGRADLGENRNCYVPLPSSTSPLHCALYEFVGRLFGLTLRTRSLLNLNLPSAIWKLLCSEPLTDADILGVDALAFSTIDAVNKVEASVNSAGADSAAAKAAIALFDEKMASVKFVAVSADGRTRKPLIDGGENISLTWNNRAQYVRALRAFRYNEFTFACSAMRRGLATVVPAQQLLSLFSWRELQMQITGRGVTREEMDLLEKMTDYSGCNASDQHIKWFWQVMRDRFTDEERAMFLAFTWGRSRLPLTAADFERRMSITSYSRSPSGSMTVDSFFPIGHTCGFSIEMPRYTSAEKLYEKVRWAILNSTDIDADGGDPRTGSANINSRDSDDDDGSSLF